ncbi:FadR family transcriptional regulator [Acidisoma cellulosilytica]|uniref:FadR family transcriptional regulator n=1 Tax=Acidisoma cellulosilyticum TaxID=2802395 RepID=A0A964E5Q6_9PROT|nr:FadR/GntR family transcriptional regulator [Acidisoma cellulosilyticum]MCB8882228.1 FadR family transcriptional regulator [Acidisoma cellulosilyticum]
MPQTPAEDLRIAPSPTRTAQLAERIGRDIRAGRLQPSQKLPTEQELIAQYQVSRTVVREAMATLRTEGLIVSRQGAGVFVADHTAARPFRIVSEELKSLVEIENVLQLRLAVEVEAAGLAAERRTDEDIALIGRALESIDEAIARGASAVKEDLDFHCAISAATGNPYFQRFMQFLGPVIIPRQTIRVGLETVEERRSYVSQVQKEHRQLFEAVRQGDSKLARRCVRTHLEASRDRYRKLAAGHHR